MDKGKDLTEVRSPQRQLAPDNVGPDQGEPTFLRGIAIKARRLVLRESEYDRGTGCGNRGKQGFCEAKTRKTARPGLCGGRRVTGVPTARRV